MIFLPTVEEAHAIGNDEGVFPASVQHGSQPVVLGTPTDVKFYDPDGMYVYVESNP